MRVDARAPLVRRAQNLEIVQSKGLLRGEGYRKSIDESCVLEASLSPKKEQPPPEVHAGKKQNHIADTVTIDVLTPEAARSAIRNCDSVGFDRHQFEVVRVQGATRRLDVDGGNAIQFREHLGEPLIGAVPWLGSRLESALSLRRSGHVRMDRQRDERVLAAPPVRPMIIEDSFARRLVPVRALSAGRGYMPRSPQND